MNILLTGANGYIGQRLIPLLLEQGHRLYCCVRNKKRFEDEHRNEHIVTIEIDFLKPAERDAFPHEVDVSYYLVHSMNSGTDFEEQEQSGAKRFIHLIQQTSCRQVIYLSG